MVDAVAARIPYAAHLILLFTLTFASLILVVLITFSSPFISAINFLNITTGGNAGGQTTFGGFGWCSPDFCLPNAVGYEYGTQVNHSLSSPMILWAISIIFIFFTVLAILPLLFVHESRALRFVGNRQFFHFFATFAALIVGVTWIISIVGWCITRRAFEISGTNATLGSAIWMGLATALCMIIVDILGWPINGWDGAATIANGGLGARGLPVAGGNNGYYHYKRTTREVLPRY